MPASSPTLSPTLSAITAGLRGSSSGMPASIFPTRSAPTSAASTPRPQTWAPTWARRAPPTATPTSPTPAYPVEGPRPPVTAQPKPPPPTAPRRALLHGAGDLHHPLAPLRLPQQPERQSDAVGKRDRRADEGEENRVVAEEVDRERLLTNSAPRLLGAAVFYHSGRTGGACTAP